jgi:hypothetical protein
MQHVDPNCISHDDWKWLFEAAQQRWARADPKPGEPKPSPAYKAQKDRLFRLLYAKVHNPRSV